MTKTLREWTRSLLDVRPRERAPVALMSAYGFLALSSHYILKPARNSVFIDRVGANSLPLVYVITAVFVTAVMVVYTRHVDRMRVRALLLGTLGFLASNLVLFWWLLDRGDSFWVSGAFYIWGKLYPLLLVSQFWLVGNLLFTTRQAKRLFGLIGVGLVLGGIAGSAMAGWATDALGTETLLLVAAGHLAACGILVEILAPRLGETDGSAGDGEEEVSGNALRLLLRSSHLRTIALLLALTIVVETLVDWQFNRAVELAVAGEDAKTAFFGRFFTLVNVASIVVQLLFTGFVLRKFGVGVAMLLLPLLLFGASLGIALAPVLGAVLVAKGAESTLRYSLDQSTRELLFLPVPTDVKYRVKPLVDLAVYRGGTGVGGILLLVGVHGLGFGIREVAVASLVLAGVWLVATFRMQREFRASLRRLIGVQDVDLDRLLVRRLDAETMDELLRAVRTGDEDEVAYALSLLERYGGAEALDDIARLTRHPSPTIRARAVSFLLESGAREYVDDVRALLDDPALDVRVEAIRYLCRHGGGAPADKIRTFLSSDESRIRVAATTCVLRYGSERERTVAEEMIADLSGSDVPEIRRSAAQLLSTAGEISPEGERILRRLCHDADAAVRHQAMRTAGVVGLDGAVGELIRRLGDPGERPAATRALQLYGRDAREPLLDALRDPDTPVHVRPWIPRLLRITARQETVDAVAGLLAEVDPPTRFEILRTLNRLRRDRSDLTFLRIDVDDVVGREAREGYEWVARLHAARQCRDGCNPLLERLLRQRWWEAVERAFRGLALRFSPEDLYASYAALTSSRPLTADRGMELFENVAPVRFRELVGPLVDPDVGLGARAAAARRRGWGVTGSRKETLEELAALPDFWVAVMARLEAGLDPRPDDVPPSARFTPVQYRDGSRPGEEEVPRIMEIVERADVLRKTEMFDSLRTEDLARIAALTSERTVPSGGILFDEEDPGSSLYVVVEGSVAARRGGRTLFVAEPGETVGDLSLIDGLPRSYRAEAREAARVLVLEREDFQNLMEERVGIARGVMEHLARVVRRMNERLEG